MATTLRVHDHCTSSTLIGGNGIANPSLLHTTLEGPTKYLLQDGHEVYLYSYMTSNGWCFMANWTICKNYILENKNVLIQNRETMTL